MASHGGFIEPGTEIICEELSKYGFSFYTFSSTLDYGLHGPDHPHHTTSHKFQRSIANELIDLHSTVCTIHVFEDSSEVVHIGGLDLNSSLLLSQSLQVAGFQTIFTNGRNGGMQMHPENICNRGKTKCGVQIEISSTLMDRFIVEDELSIIGIQFVDVVGSFWQLRDSSIVSEGCGDP